MQRKNLPTMALRAAAATLLVLGPLAAVAVATEPCDDFGECKTIIEINATDGDIGFHFLMDGDDLLGARIFDPNGTKLFQDRATGPLAEQFLTETFAESAEPLCWDDPEADPDEEIVTLTEFLDRWADGTYLFVGKGEDPGLAFGETDLTHELPAAPQDVDFVAGVISWSAGDDLGNCATSAELDVLVADGDLPIHPQSVAVDSWEVVLEPDVESGDPTGDLKYSIRLPGDVSPMQVTVPADYLASLPDDTPVKVEVGAFGGNDNATFSEADGFCVNEVDGCEE